MRKPGNTCVYVTIGVILPTQIYRDYTRPELPTCESDIVSQPSASGPVMPDISAAIAGKGGCV